MKMGLPAAQFTFTIEAKEQETMENDKCTIDMKVYNSGDQVCDEKLCYVCKDGIWQSRGALDFLAQVGGP